MDRRQSRWIFALTARDREMRLDRTDRREVCRRKRRYKLQEASDVVDRVDRDISAIKFEIRNEEKPWHQGRNDASAELRMLDHHELALLGDAQRNGMAGELVSSSSWTKRLCGGADRSSESLAFGNSSKPRVRIRR
jgi:hypothetical protein